MSGPLQRFVAGMVIALASIQAVAHAQFRTLNFDFGNGPVYSGANGILSSFGGTHWNKVNVQSFPPGSGIAPQFDFSPLLDEFGQPFGWAHEYPAADLASGFHAGQVNTDTASGPLGDGVTLQPNFGFFGFSIRQIVPDTPVAVVIYFNSPPSQGTTSTVELSSLYWGSVSGSFPGVSGRDYLLFIDPPTGPTTLGYPELPGVIINVPSGSIAHIAAIQIRAHFVPEPASAMLMGMATCVVGLMRTRKLRFA